MSRTVPMTDLQSQLAEARRQRAVAFQATQALNAKKEEEERRALKLQQLLKTAEYVASLPPIDRPARIMGRFVRKCKENGLFGMRNWVEVDEQRYPVDVAFQMEENNMEPFNSSIGKCALDRYINRDTNQQYASTLRLNDNQQQLLMLVAFCNTCQPNMKGVVFPEFLMELMTTMGVMEPEEMMRVPFGRKDDKEKNDIVFWFRVFIVVQCHLVPSWVGGTSEEWMETANIKMEEKLTAYNNAIAQRQQIMEEIYHQPGENEEVQCTNSDCGMSGLVRDMFRKEGASFFFCRNCAPLIGINVPYPQDNYDEPPISSSSSSDASTVVSPEHQQILPHMNMSDHDDMSVHDDMSDSDDDLIPEQDI